MRTELGAADAVFPWQRYWLPVGPSAVAHTVVLSEANGVSRGARLTDIADTPCLVLLGEPGMGKTFEIERLASVLSGRGSRVDLVRGRDKGLKSKLAQLAVVDHLFWGVEEGRPRHILIDGVDEIPGSPSAVESLLDNFLDQLFSGNGDVGRLCVALTCRSAAWTEGLDRLIEQRWPSEGFRKLVLAPLSDADIIASINLAELQPVERDRLTKRLLNEQMRAIAGRPLLLRMLLHNDFGKGSILGRQGDLLARVIEGALTANGTDVAALVNVAGRLAAVTTFSGQARFSSVVGSDREDLLPVTRIAGGIEPATGGGIVATPALLSSVLRSSLFSEIEGGVFEWAHRTLVDFLTARYLTAHQLSSDQILSLLNVPEIGGPGGIPSQHVEVAAWTAAMMPSFFDVLLEKQPDILLRSQAAVLEPDHRARLTGAILQRFASGNLIDQYNQLVPLFGSLSHAGLAEQLRPAIALPATPPFERRAAIDIATENGATSLVPTLLETARDPRADGIIRSLAARAVWRLRADDAGSLLGSMLKEDLSSDTQDRLRGLLLAICWPDSLAFSDLLAALTPPKQANFIGQYELFLSRFVAPKMSSERALATLSWLQSRLDGSIDHGSGLLPVMSKLFQAAATQISDPEVRRAMAAMITMADRNLQPIALTGDQSGPSWPDNTETRTALVLEVLERVRDPVSATVSLTMYLPGLIRSGDLYTFLALLLKAPGGGLREALSRIVVDLTSKFPLDTLDHIWSAASQITELQSRLSEHYSVAIDSPSAGRMKLEMVRRHEAQEAEAREGTALVTWRSAITGLLDRVEAGEPELWWQVNFKLFQDPDRSYNANLEFEADLTEAPGWLALDDAERERIIRTAALYLTKAPLTDISWLGTNTSHRPANAGLRALRLLLDKAAAWLETLTHDTWAAWSPAILGFFGNDFHSDGDTQRALLREAFRHAPGSVLAALRQIATGDNSGGLSSRTFELLDGMLSPDLSATLNELRCAENLKGESAASDILAFLIRNGDAESVKTVRDALASPLPPASGQGGMDAASLARATVELLISDPARTWYDVLELRERDEGLARMIWVSFATQISFDRSFAFDALPEYALAQGYIDLLKLLPERPPSTKGTRILGVPDYVEQLRSALLGRLVAIGSNSALEQLYRIKDLSREGSDTLTWPIEQARRNVRSNWARREDPAELLARIADMSADSGETALAPVPGPEAEPDDSDDVPIEIKLVLPDPRSSGPLAPEQRRNILVVATEWTSYHGGISTLSRELCAALATLDHSVTCLVLAASSADILDARTVRVELVACPCSVGIDGGHRFLLCQQEHVAVMPDLVVGHDHITGPYARALAERFNAKYVHLLHTIPQENEGLKIYEGGDFDPMRGESKMEAQVALAAVADLVVAVGPRIMRFFQQASDPPKMAMLMPGLNRTLLDLKPDHQTLSVNSCLMSGRMEDAGVKGGLLACDVIKLVATGRSWGNKRTPNLVMRGFTKEHAKTEFEKIGEFSSFSQFVQLRSFSTDPTKLHQDYLKSALIIMPSVAEGFGLTGLEAIAAGVPVILSDASGLAEYLMDPAINEGLDLTLVAPCIAPVALDEAGNRKAWGEKVDAALFDHAASFKRAADLRSALEVRLTWEGAARKLSDEFFTL